MIRYAIVGAGMMGQEHIRNIHLLSDTSIAAVVDPDPAMREQSLALARSTGSHSVKEFSTLQDFLAAYHDGASPSLQVDCAVVASPNHTHIDLMRMLLETDLPILVEKPLCTTVADVRAIEKLSEARAAAVWVAMEYRYMPPTARLIERLNAGEAGALKMLTIREHRYPFLDKVQQWNRFNANTGGTLVEKCCHYFDLMRLISGAEATRVYASGAIDVNHLNETYDGAVPDIIDNAFAIVDFSNGLRASLDLCMFTEGSDPQEVITAIGDQGKLEARIPGPDRFWPQAGHRPSSIVAFPREAVAASTEVIEIDEVLMKAGDHHGSTFYQHQKFADVVSQGLAVEVTASDGARAVEMGAAAEQSIRTGKAVNLDSDLLT